MTAQCVSTPARPASSRLTRPAHLLFLLLGTVLAALLLAACAAPGQPAAQETPAPAQAAAPALPTEALAPTVGAAQPSTLTIDLPAAALMPQAADAPTVAPAPAAAQTPFQPSAPYYGTFYYPWFANPAAQDADWGAWDQRGSNPPATWFAHYLPDPAPGAFDPAHELYSSRDPAVVYWQLQKMAEAKMEFAVASWWGAGEPTDAAFRLLIADLMNRPDNPYPNLRWALYYEREGSGNPPVEQIVADLNYIADNYAQERAYFRIGGRPVIFVYATGDDGAEMVQRWADARAQAKLPFYVVLKVFRGYADSAPQPDGWHQYGPATRSSSHSPHSFVVSPGFWLGDEAEPRLARDLGAFRGAVQEMVAAETTFKLVTTWNEWGEGTGVEPAVQVRLDEAQAAEVADPEGTPFGNAYVDVLAELLPPLEAGTGAPVAGGGTVGTAGTADAAGAAGAEQGAASFTFGAAGDIGFSDAAQAMLAGAGKAGLDFFLAVGDLSYENKRREEDWCAFVHEQVGPDFSFEVLAGNHEDETQGDDGYIARYAACLPDRLGAAGVYAHQFWFDYPRAAPLARFILIDADLYRDGERVEYCKDGEKDNCAWLAARIDEAKALGLWTIVGVHKNCFTIGDKPCEIGAELVNLLAEKKVDLVIQGHDHGYQRSKQVALGGACPGLVEGQYDPACIVDDGAGNRYARGAGMMWVISAVGGVAMYDIHTDDPEIGYLTRWMDRQAESTGFLKVSVTAQQLDVQFVATTGEFGDAFTIEAAGAAP